MAGVILEKRKILKGLNTAEYEHSLDKITLEALRNIPVVPKLIELVGVPFNTIQRIDTFGSHLRVTEKQFPSIHRMLREACEILDMPEPLLYVCSQPQLNAYTSCPDKPIIVLYSYLLDMLVKDEIMFIIGHELGHIKSQHIIYSVLGDALSSGVLDMIVSTVPGFSTIYGAAKVALTYAFFEWMQTSEYSCDRAGFLACQNYEASCRALMKLAGASKTYAYELNLEEFLKQAQEFEDIDHNALGKIAKIYLSYGDTHPWSVTRVRELMKFRENGDYDKILQRQMPLPELSASNPNSPQNKLLGGLLGKKQPALPALESQTDPVSAMKKLKELLDLGLIEQSEYDTKKADIMKLM